MAHSSPPTPTPATKPKDRPIVTFILAILLHALLAAIVYITVFDHKKTPDIKVLTPKNEPVLMKPMITEDIQVTSDNIDTSTAEVAVNAIKSATSKALPSRNNPATQNRKPQELTQSMIETSNTSVNDNNPVAAVKAPASSNQQSPSEYRLQKTQEHQALDDEIDKDSEQLSKLINEVKQRNQQQINEQRAAMLVAQPRPAANSVSDPLLTAKPSDLTYDYPITPITPSNSGNNP